MTTHFDNIITLAQQYGSTATTLSGAVRFLQNKSSLTNDLAANFADAWAYRRAESRWAGGAHIIRVRLDDEPQSICHTERVWSKNGKWSGNNSHAVLKITPAALDCLGVDGLIIGGLITLHAEQVGPREYKAVWARQSRGVSLTEQAGWIIRGYHSTAKTLDQARKQAAAARKKAVDAALQLRARRLMVAHEAENYKSVFVSYDDARAAGCCVPGIDNVTRRIKNSIGPVAAVRGDVLLRMATPSEYSYALRAVEAARDRHA